MIMTICAIAMIIMSAIGLCYHVVRYKKTQDERERKMYILFLISGVSSIIVFLVSYIQYNTIVRMLS